MDTLAEAGTEVGAAAVTEPIIDRPMFGIDVSHHQGKINWLQVATKNVPKVDFAYIKATEGASSKDNKCAINAREAVKNKIPISYYHFATLNREDEAADAKEEAKFFLDSISTLPKNDLPLALDIESMGKVQLDDGEVLAYIKAFFEVLDQAGKKYVLYSYTPFLNEHLPPNHDLGHIPLWIAAYTNRPTPKLPVGWDKFWLWQYLASAPGFIGRCAGISTACDLNKSTGNIF